MPFLERKWSLNPNFALSHSFSTGFNWQNIEVLFQVITWLQTWWRHQMETFSALLAVCARNSPVPGEFPAQRPVALSFDVFFDLSLNKRLSKHLWGWWFETLSRPFWRHCNEQATSHYICQTWPTSPMHACVTGPQWYKWSICAFAQPTRDDVTLSLIGRVHTQNHPCKWSILTRECWHHI